MPQVINTVTKASPTDNYAVVRDTDLSGSYRIVADVTERDAIVSNQRKRNMLVFVISDLHFYQLQSDLLTWTDLGTSLGGSTALYVDITRAALQALIAGGTLVPGTLYAITDFLDKTTTDTNSRVIVTATSINTISQTGFWTRLTQNKAYGAFTLSGIVGNVSQISVGGVNLMTATVNYTTSPINTANLIATNVNANSGVSGYRCIVCAGSTLGLASEQVPALVIEKVLAGVDTGAIVVTATLTIGSVTNMTMGLAQVNQVLDISYDITADRIIACYDSQYDNRMAYTTTQISTLGYNPIVNWRWGHGTFRSWYFNGVAYRDFFDFPPTSGTNTIEQQNTLTEGGIDKCVIRRTNPASLSLSFNVSLTLTSANLMAETVINNNKIKISCTNFTNASSGLTITNNIGSNAVGQINGVFLTNVRLLGAFTYTINGNNATRIAMNGGFAGGVNFSTNYGNNFQIGTSVSKYFGFVTITGNFGGTRSVSFPVAPNSATPFDCALTFTNNDFSQSSVTNLSFGITRTALGKTYNFSNNIIRGNITTSIVSTEDINIDKVTFGGDFILRGLNISNTTTITNTTFEKIADLELFDGFGNFNIQDSSFFGDIFLIDGVTFTCIRSSLTELNLNAFWQMSFTDTTFGKGVNIFVVGSAFFGLQDYTFQNVRLSYVNFIINSTGAGSVVVSIIDTEMERSDLSLTSEPATSFTIQNSSIIRTDLDLTNDASGFNYVVENMYVENNIGYYKKNFTFTGASGFGLVGTQSPVFSSIFGQDSGIKMVITNAIIASVSGLTAGAGSQLSLGQNATFDNLIPTSLVTTLNTNLQLKNAPLGITNKATAYTINQSVSLANSITSGTITVIVEFIILN